MAGTGWQNYRASDDADFTGNIGILLGDRSGGLVDIDLDCKEAIKLAPAILPETDAIFGRQSKVKSHWLYLPNSPMVTEQFQTKKDGMLIELRSTGCQTVFPPSVHQSGERIEWNGPVGAPARVDCNVLAGLVRELASVALLVRHWPEETGRYNTEGALIGTLLRAGWDEDRVEKMMMLIRSHAGEAPRHPPAEIIPRLVGRLRTGKSVPGLKRLTELLGADITGKVVEWLGLKNLKAVSSYEYRDSGTYYTFPAAGGEPRVMRLANFCAEITQIIDRDDGSGVIERSFIVESGPDKTEIPAGDFDSMGWVTAQWGPLKSVTPGRETKPHLAEAIKSNSADAERNIIYTHTGWIKIEGEHFYLHAGGAIGRAGPVDGFIVELSGKLKHYLLPEVKDLREAIRASLSMRELGPTGMLMLSAVYRAPLAEFLEITSSVFVEGKTGTYKSTIQGLAMSHWGTQWDGVLFPANWTGTANSLEKVAHSLKDALCVVDDFKPSGPSYEIEKLHQTAERLLRAAANHGGRSRMNANSTLREEYFPRGLVMSSGEDVPKGHSLRSRLVLHRVEKDEVNLDALTRLQQRASEGAMAEAMAGYVRWLAGKATPKFREELRETQRQLRKDVTGEHARTPGNIASLLIGLNCFAKFAQESGAISEDEALSLCDDGKLLLVSQANIQDAEQASEDPAKSFVDCLAEALAAGRVHLAMREGGAPVGLENACGWRERHYQDQVVWQPCGDCIGWIEAGTAYIRPSVAYAAAEQLSRQQNRSLALTKETLLKRLVAAGFVEKSTTVRAAATVNRVYLMKSALILPTWNSGATDVSSNHILEFITSARRVLPVATGRLRVLVENAIEYSQLQLWEDSQI